MEFRQVAKGGISLVVLIIITYFTCSTKEQGIKHIPKVVRTDKSTALAKSKKVSHCQELQEKLKAAHQNHLPPLTHWINYYLLKNGEEFLVRIERDVNGEGLEIKRLKLFQLAQDGFPTLITDKILEDIKEVSSFFKSHQLIASNRIESYDNETLLVERSGEKVVKITDVISNQSCKQKTKERHK